MGTRNADGGSGTSLTPVHPRNPHEAHHSLAAALTLASSAALAQAPAPAAPPPPDAPATANVGIFSEYIFRGISQTAGKPAVQGGFDYAHTQRLLRRHVGVEHQLAAGLRRVQPQSSLEWDFYGGFKKNFGDTDWFWDVGTHLLLLPRLEESRRRLRRHVGGLRRDRLEVGERQAQLQPRRLLRRCARTARQTDGTLLRRPVRDLSGRRDRLRADRPLRLPGRRATTLRRRPASSVVHRLEARRVVHGARRPGEGPRGRRVLHGQRREVALYTDLTGYDTAKDRGVVYVKKTF